MRRIFARTIEFEIQEIQLIQLIQYIRRRETRFRGSGLTLPRLVLKVWTAGGCSVVIVDLEEVNDVSVRPVDELEVL